MAVDAVARILLVDDEAENLRALERTLRDRFELVSVSEPYQALQEIERCDFAVVVSDQRMPGMQGTELLARIGAKKPLISLIILTAYTETQEILEAINRAEIYRYVVKPWDNRELISTIQQAVDHHRLLKRNQELIQNLREKEQELERLVESRTAQLREANEKLNELAMTDPLTKVLNRRAMFQKMEEEIERSKRYRHPLAAAMIDVDHFKLFNDREGHLCGDEALRRIAQAFSSSIRRTDILCRYGGEEFLLMMPETSMDAAVEICERLRVAIEKMEFQGQKNSSCCFTISVGVSGFYKDGGTAESLIQAADRALYEAKQSGRNRVVR